MRLRHMRIAFCQSVLLPDLEDPHAEPADMHLAILALHVHTPRVFLDAGFALGAISHIVLFLVASERLHATIGVEFSPFRARHPFVPSDVACGADGR